MRARVLLAIGMFLVFNKAAPAQVKQDDYNKLKQELESVTADRNNILAQTKNLIEIKTKYQQSEAVMNQLKADKDNLLKEHEALQAQNLQLLEKIGTLERNNAQLSSDMETNKKNLAKMEADYKIVTETRKEIGRLQNENNALEKEVKQWQGKIKRIEEEQLNAQAQMDIYRLQIKEWKKRYGQAMIKNKTLEKKAEQMPRRFTELARENRMLLKETAMMHYNLGVFYTKEKEFSRAIAEYEKAIELNPEEPSAYYNLGYIYAEYLVNRPKAIEKFRKFLSLIKSDDKDVDWVKKYILTWETWEGKKPIK
jgi:tetratricopeptide (TPR) repeat protein